jgi:hypothetical protein
MLNPVKKTSEPKEFLPRKCRYCGTGLVRRVTKTKLTFKAGGLSAKSA